MRQSILPILEAHKFTASAYIHHHQRILLWLFVYAISVLFLPHSNLLIIPIYLGDGRCIYNLEVQYYA